MKDKTYLVLTPEKIEDIFRDLESKLDGKQLFFERKEHIKKVLESKKQELLKSIK